MYRVLDLLQRHPGWVFVLALLLTLPALFSGWLGDDYIHYALLHPDVQIPRANDWSLFGLFSWVDAEPARTAVLMDRGVVPWWVYEGFQYQFWRPLAELSHWLDHQLWRDVPPLMHAHSVLWYLAAGWAVWRVYQGAGMSAFAAVVALAVYVWDSSHGMTLAWIANRNALMATFFGVLSLLAFLRWRQTGRESLRGLSLLSLLASLLCGEIGISTMAYLVAYSVCVDAQGPRRALLSLWPYVLLCALWWTLYKLGNFGANHSDINYIDPLESPLIFLNNVVERIPVLLFSQFGLVPAELFGMSQGQLVGYVGIAVVSLLLLLWLVWPVLRHSPLARFWALGCLLSAAPISASIPADRNLMMVGVGASALIGLVLEAAVQRWVASRRVRVAAVALFAVHLLIAPLLLPVFSYSPKLLGRLMGMDVSLSMPVASSHENVLLFGLNMPVALATTPMRFAHGETVPSKVWLMSSQAMDYEVVRVAPHQLEIRSETGLVTGLEAGLRDLQRHPLPVGHVIQTPAMRLTVQALDAAGHPTELLFETDATELDRTVIISWQPDGFQRHRLPEEGERMVLALSGDSAGLRVADAE